MENPSGSKGVLLHCDLWEVMTPDELREIAQDLSELMNPALVIGITCDDSDQLIFAFAHMEGLRDLMCARTLGCPPEPNWTAIWDEYSQWMGDSVWEGGSRDDEKRIQELFRQDCVLESDFLFLSENFSGLMDLNFLVILKNARKQESSNCENTNGTRSCLSLK